MTQPRASHARTVGGDSVPVVDPRREDFDPERFVSGQVAMMEIAEVELKESLAQGSFRLKLSFLARLHRAGYAFVDAQAGHFRQDQVFIENSALVPPPAEDVLPHLEEMCAFINDNFSHAPAIFVAAYALWRLLWIHPFREGNGSVARILCYTLIRAKMDNRIGADAERLFEFIADHRDDYYLALSEADEAWAAGSLDLGLIERLLQDALMWQGRRES